MDGWVKLHRKIVSSHAWANSSAEQKVILITLILMVNHKAGEAEIDNKIYKLSPGQTITSLQHIKDKCGKGVSIQNIRTALKRFEKLQFLTQKVTKRFRLITICKYGSYQSSNIVANTNSNKELTTNKNDKEIKEGLKAPLSFVFSDLMKSKKDIFIDKDKDLKRLHIISTKVKNLIKQKKLKQGLLNYRVNREEIIEGFKFIINNLSAWEMENRFFPEYLLNNFSSIINKILSKTKPTKKEAPKLKASAFKNLK